MKIHYYNVMRYEKICDGGIKIGKSTFYIHTLSLLDRNNKQIVKTSKFFVENECCDWFGIN